MKRPSFRQIEMLCAIRCGTAYDAGPKPWWNAKTLRSVFRRQWAGLVGTRLALTSAGLRVLGAALTREGST